MLQIIYPLSCEEVAQSEEGESAKKRLHQLDSRLDQLMGVVRLKYLLQRQGGWDSVAEWGDVLSLGDLVPQLALPVGKSKSPEGFMPE